jgi:hypothetical protein
LQARFTAVLRRADDGRVSPSPFSCSSSLEAERLNPRVLVGLPAKGCCTGDIDTCSIVQVVYPMSLRNRCAAWMIRRGRKPGEVGRLAADVTAHQPRQRSDSDCTRCCLIMCLPSATGTLNMQPLHEAAGCEEWAENQA